MAKNSEEPKVVDPFFNDGFEEAAPKKLWVVVAEGVTFCAIPLDREKRRTGEGKDQHILTLEITNPGNLTLQKGSDTTDDLQTMPANKGDIVCIDEKARLMSVGELAEDEENKWEVKILAIAKVDLGKGKTMWNFKVGKRLLEKFKTTTTRRNSGHPNAPGNM